MSWALNNHWMVNFKASQEGHIPLRYRFTTHAGRCDYADANRFALEESVAPVVLRDYKPTGAASGTLFELPDLPGIEAHLKVATFGDGLILRLRNITTDDVRIPLDVLRSNGTVSAVDVLERPMAQETMDSSPEQLIPAFGEVSIRITPV